ncbi:hypothetical protein AMATHDRAFT_4904 [Amanita thiersii Skay4041]|uniref:Uncharacterized protein n=1 Tax=Amanita thiersii Skay4041 TaxID=703135 RepID=A0A2A9NP54_9AGAR|nr:hypothetical protein AMATHDRAFT_4904 [Amanita thiersii Skay4041]
MARTAKPPLLRIRSRAAHARAAAAAQSSAVWTRTRGMKLGRAATSKAEISGRLDVPAATRTGKPRSAKTVKKKAGTQTKRATVAEGKTQVGGRVTGGGPKGGEAMDVDVKPVSAKGVQKKKKLVAAVSAVLVADARGRKTRKKGGKGGAAAPTVPSPPPPAMTTEEEERIRKLMYDLFDGPLTPLPSRSPSPVPMESEEGEPEDEPSRRARGLTYDASISSNGSGLCEDFEDKVDELGLLIIKLVEDKERLLRMPRECRMDLRIMFTELEKLVEEKQRVDEYLKELGLVRRNRHAEGEMERELRELKEQQGMIQDDARPGPSQERGAATEVEVGSSTQKAPVSLGPCGTELIDPDSYEPPTREKSTWPSDWVLRTLRGDSTEIIL